VISRAGGGLLDQLPPDVTLVSATATQDPFYESGGVVTCRLGTLENDGMATVSFVIRPTLAGHDASVSASLFGSDLRNSGDAEDMSIRRITSRRSPTSCG
jgi:hypothetical protein